MMEKNYKYKILQDRKSTRMNTSQNATQYAVICKKKKKKKKKKKNKNKKKKKKKEKKKKKKNKK